MSLGKLFAGIFVVLIVSIGIVIFGGGSGSSQTPSEKNKNVVAEVNLPGYAKTNATISMTVDGRINGDDLHRSIRVTIGRDTRTLQIMQGYHRNVIFSQSQPNNQEAFDVFLRALQSYGATSKNTKSKVVISDDERGACAFGKTYVFELNHNSKQVMKRWKSTCNSIGGTLGTGVSNLELLFKAQITDFDKLTNKVQF